MAISLPGSLSTTARPSYMPFLAEARRFITPTTLYSLRSRPSMSRSSDTRVSYMVAMTPSSRSPGFMSSLTSSTLSCSWVSPRYAR